MGIRKVFSDVLNVVQPVASHKGVVLNVTYTQTYDDSLKVDGSAFGESYFFFSGSLFNPPRIQPKDLSRCEGWSHVTKYVLSMPCIDHNS